MDISRRSMKQKTIPKWKSLFLNVDDGILYSFRKSLGLITLLIVVAHSYHYNAFAMRLNTEFLYRIILKSNILQPLFA